MIDLVPLIGDLSGLILSLSFIPQIRKMWANRRNDFDEISPTWILITLIGGSLYLLFGFLLPNLGIIILNIVANASMILMLLIYLGVWKNERFRQRT